jgi:hypothetical protein
MARLVFTSGRPDPEWFCDQTTMGENDYYVMALRKPRGARDEIYSSLIGWFAVSRQDGTVSEWDLEKEKPVPVSPEYGARKSGR